MTANWKQIAQDLADDLAGYEEDHGSLTRFRIAIFEDDSVASLKAFWHKTRSEFVPLTPDEWTRKAGCGINFDKMVECKYVKPRGDCRTGAEYYELTKRGKDAAQEMMG